MNKTAIAITTIYRPLKLKLVVESIPKEYPVVIACWNEERDTMKMDRDYILIEMDGASICERSWAITEMMKDYNILGLCDDTKIFSDTISKAERQLEMAFGDSNGVCGIQCIHNHPEPVPNYAFCLYGSKWIDSFEDRKIYCPEYQRFCIDREWHLNAVTSKRWTYCHNSWVYHMDQDNDKTHNFGDREKIIQEDTLTYIRRRHQGVVWGLNG